LVILRNIIAYTVKPVLRGHLWDKEKVSLQGWRLPKRGIFNHMTRKSWPFNTGDCLIEVITWAGLTV